MIEMKGSRGEESEDLFELVLLDGFLEESVEAFASPVAKREGSLGSAEDEKRAGVAVEARVRLGDAGSDLLHQLETRDHGHVEVNEHQ